MPTYTYTHQVDTTATAQAVWALYEDVGSWPRWDAGAEYVTRDGPFAAGVGGTMKPAGQEPLRYRLSKVIPLREFVDETPAGELLVRVCHRLDPRDDGRLRITYTVEIDGPRDQAEAVGPAITADFPATMAALIALAESRSP